MTETSNPNPDKNQHITEYLEYYINQAEPADSAILLTGSWGCGKTYYIDRFIDNYKNIIGKQLSHFSPYALQAIAPISYTPIVQKCLNQKEYKNTSIILKISLFGLKSIAELDKSILLERFALSNTHLTKADKFFIFLSKSSTQLVDTLFTKNILKQFGLNFVNFIKSTTLSKQAQQIILILDDLERTDIPLKELLGHINAFIERDHIKIILIANDNDLTKELIHQEQTKEEKETSKTKAYISEDDLKNREIYKKFKEKVIGKTFEVQSVLDTVLTYFIDQHQYHDLISPYRNIIEFIYTKHHIQNLRQLKQSLDDFRYFLDHLDENHRQNPDFLKDLIYNFFDLKLIILKHHSLPDSFDQQTNLIYPTEIWERILLKNDYSEIKEITNQLSYFIPKKEQPLWMRLYFFKTLDDHVFDTLSKQLLHDFNTLKKEDYYEYFHIIGLVISWSELKLISETTEEIEQTAQRYLEKHSHNWLKKYRKKWSNFHCDSSIDNYSGYGYQSFKTPNFIRIRKLFYQKQEIIISKIKQLQLESDTLYYIHQNEVTVLKEFLQYKNEHKLIFNQINLEKFFKTLLELNNQQLSNLNRAIHSRYLKEQNTPLHFFVSELHFWEQIFTKLDGYLNQHDQSRSIRNCNLQRFLTLSQKIINDLYDNKYIFIIDLLRMRHFDNLEKCLCDNNQYGQLLFFEERGDYMNLQHNLPRSAEEELTNFNRILIRRYNNLQDISIIKLELSFWHKFIQDLEKEEKTNKVVNEEAYSKLILMLKQITQKIEEEILNRLV